MPRIGTPASVITAISALAFISGANAAEVCSAWSEPAAIAAQMAWRKDHRMRADPAWVLEVARSPQSRFGFGTILMTPEEQQEFQARRAKAAGNPARRAMIDQALQYADQHGEDFAGSYLRRISDDLFDPPAAYVLRFKGDLDVHRAALAKLPTADISLEILPARYSMQQLLAVMQSVQRRAKSPDRDITWLSWWPDPVDNIVKIEAESDARDAARRLETGHRAMVKAIIHPRPDDSKWPAVTQGPGWRLLGIAQHPGGPHEEEMTRLATSDAEWRDIRAVTQLPIALRSVDFSREIVLTFTESRGCGELRLADIVINVPLQSIAPSFARSGSSRMACTMQYTGYDVFAIAVERAALPPNPIAVPNRPSRADRKDPAYCPRGLMIPR